MFVDVSGRPQHQDLPGVDRNFLAIWTMQYDQAKQNYYLSGHGTERLCIRSWMRFEFSKTCSIKPSRYLAALFKA
jgi:hypothetical protein